MTQYDVVPAALSLPVATAADLATGPSQSEWKGLIIAALTLLVREALWWFRNRKGGGDITIPPSGG